MDNFEEDGSQDLLLLAHCLGIQLLHSNRIKTTVGRLRPPVAFLRAWFVTGTGKSSKSCSHRQTSDAFELRMQGLIV